MMCPHSAMDVQGGGGGVISHLNRPLLKDSTPQPKGEQLGGLVVSSHVLRQGRIQKLSCWGWGVQA